MRNAVVIFTKVPKAGETKTRLTTERGGILTPEEAKDFYEASLLDVVDCCIEAACCDIYVCHDLGGDGTYLRQILDGVSAPRSIRKIFTDNGGSFDKGMQYAADHMLQGEKGERLVDAILIVGGDMPTLQPGTIRKAFAALERLATTVPCDGAAPSANGDGQCIGPAMVVSADQECGFNILGYTHSTPFDFSGVFYNQDGITALDMISYKAMEHTIPLGMLDIVPDVDVIVDFAGFISVVKTMQLAEKYDPTIKLPKRTIQALEVLGLVATAPVPVNFTNK